MKGEGGGRLDRQNAFATLTVALNNSPLAHRPPRRERHASAGMRMSHCRSLESPPPHVSGCRYDQKVTHNEARTLSNSVRIFLPASVASAVPCDSYSIAEET